MASVEVSNSPLSSNPDIPVRADVNTLGEQIQVVRLDVGTGTTEVPFPTPPWEIKGENAENTPFTKPVTCAYKDIFTGVSTVPHTINFLGTTYQLGLQPDLDLHFIDYTPAGEVYALSHSSDGLKSGATYARLGVNKEQYTTEQPLGTPASTNVAGSVSTVTLSAADTTRRVCTIYNDSAVKLYVKLGAAASTTSFTVLLNPADYYETPAGYTGIVTAVFSGASGFARITELRV